MYARAIASPAPSSLRGDTRDLSRQNKVKDRNNIEGPCCQSARVAVDSAEVPKANPSVSNRARGRESDWEAMRNISTAAIETRMEAMTRWGIFQKSRLISPVAQE